MGFWDIQDWFGGYDEGAANAAEQRKREEADRLRLQAQTAADATAKAEADRLAGLRTSAADTARTGAQRYFTERGLDASKYGSNIDEEINNILGTISSSDPTPGLHFKDFGQNVYNRAQESARDRATSNLSKQFGPDYEYGKIANTADDPFLAQIDTEQRGKANEYIDRLLKRGVITDTGASGAYKGLDEQGAGVRSQLSGIGGDILAGGRDDLGKILGRARSAAGGLSLGNDFDIGRYQSELDQTFNDFMGGLGEKIKGSITEPLYDTSGLASLAGSTSGAQNTKFDPFALAGQEAPVAEDETKKKKTFF
jgi:hypothetical protein